MTAREEVEMIAALAGQEGGYMLSGQAEDAARRDALEALYTPGEIGHFVMFDDDEEYVRALIQPYVGEGLPPLFAVEWPESVYVDRLIFTTEERALAHLYNENPTKSEEDVTREKEVRA